MDQHVGDQAYRAAVTDLLGVLAYGELTAALRIAADGLLAPSLSVKAGIASLAATEVRHYESLVQWMRRLDINPEQAMQPFVAPFAAFHERTRPRSWLEGLTKAYVGDGIAKDFYREMSSFVDAETRDVMAHALDDEGSSDFIVGVVNAAIRTDPRESGRQALWCRRLLGEALSQAQAVAVDRDSLATLLVGRNADLSEVGEMFTRLQQRHQERMARLGLSA